MKKILLSLGALLTSYFIMNAQVNYIEDSNFDNIVLNADTMVSVINTNSVEKGEWYFIAYDNPNTNIWGIGVNKITKPYDETRGKEVLAIESVKGAGTWYNPFFWVKE